MEVRPEQGTDGGADVPTCFRHPDRQTYLSCVRCGRPACPDCLRPAPVGHQCVECVRDGARGTRRAAAAFGGRPVSGAVVTWVLVGLNVLMYLAEWVYPPTYDKLEMLGIAVEHGQSYRLITSAFLHYPGLGGFGPAHIIFNMWALVLVGPALERVLGHLRFTAVYLLSAFGGSVLFYWLAPLYVPALGASGAIFGLFAAWFVLARRQRLDSRAVVFLIVINLALGFVVPSIAWQAHVGGLITGGLVTAAYVYAPRSQRGLVQAGATLAVVAVLVVAILGRNAALASSALGLG